MCEKRPFTYPFCYKPAAEIVDAAKVMIHRISLDRYLDAAFGEGKMLGVLMVRNNINNQNTFLYGFSGNVGGRSHIPGFVPPIYDLTDPKGHYKLTEARISAITEAICQSQDETEIRVLKEKRKSMSVGLQDWIFDQYKVSNALGETKTIREVFADKGLIPPGGTGECAAPKLLQYAYTHDLTPLAMGEFWYGASPSREIRHQGSFYPACTGKCGPLLDFMLRGLEVEPNPLELDIEARLRVIYEDDSILVVDKPSGILSVPGRTCKSALTELLARRTGGTVYSCHRLDMDTSGLMVYAKTPEAQACIEQQFETRTVSKKYRARLIAGPEAFTGPDKGTIELPLITDWYDRPRQMVDYEHGKRAVTDYQITQHFPNGEMEVLFTPHTGRTHQLRVHSAHPEGLGHPIKGDRLYGGMSNEEQAREELSLRAVSLAFYHPKSGERMEFSLDSCE